MRKRIRAVWKRTAVLLFAFALIYAMPVYAQSGEVSVETTVPKTHSAVLLITGGGTVNVNGDSYTVQDEEIQLRIPRLEEATWTFAPAKGYVIKHVMYNELDVTAELTGQTYTAAPVNEDGTRVEVIFVKGQDDSGTDDRKPGTDSGQPGTGSGAGTAGGQQSGGSGKTGNVKTGDETNPGLFIGIMAVSIAAAAGCMLAGRRKKKA